MGELAAKCCPSIQPGPVIRYGVLSPPYRKWDWGQRRDLGGRLRWSCVRSRAAAALSYSRPLTSHNSIDNSPLTVDNVITERGRCHGIGSVVAEPWP